MEGNAVMGAGGEKAMCCEVMRQGMTAPRGWGRQGPDSPLLPPEETNPALILALKT